MVKQEFFIDKEEDEFDEYFEFENNSTIIAYLAYGLFSFVVFVFLVAWLVKWLS